MLWSWILAVVGLAGFVLAGRHVWWCWYINLGCQVLWFAYAIVTHQFGFIASAIVYSVVFFGNARKWTREHHEKQLKSGTHNG
jgi:NADH:ubiquinone oxidoreductase subunit 5 (subunit L)/multisubunit Na+/H+ antiporter MnhA subunit